jgi:sugar phosphate isomerase/epimerase
MSDAPSPLSTPTGVSRSRCPAPFRVGATSYVLPDHILPNVEYLASLVDDVELVLFETDEYGSNLPDEAVRARLSALALENDLTYTVHLPLDLRLGDVEGQDDLSLIKALRAIEATQGLCPHAYVMHLDGTVLLDSPSSHVMTEWVERSRRVLAHVCSWLDEPQRLCVENVEGWDPDLLTPVLDRLPVGRVVDVGHLWLQRRDPVEHLRRWVDRTRVVHIHGIGTRDHLSLGLVPQQVLDPVIAFLAGEFTGVVTLEVFSVDDLTSSMAALNAALRRCKEAST